MKDGRRPPGLPDEVERLIARVLDEAGLDFVTGRREVERELRAHFEDGLAAGASPEEMVRRFGDPVVTGRRIARTGPRAAARRRGQRGRWWMSGTEWGAEVRRAVRRLARAPGFAAVVVATLALGVGVNTAIFTVLNAVLLEDLPYHEPHRLVRVYESHVEDPGMQTFLRAPVLAEYRTWDEVFDAVGGIYTYREVGADLGDGDAPRRVTVARVSAGYFETLGVRPERGRTFLDAESFGPGEAGSTTVPIVHTAVLSHDLWTSHFGRAPDIVGGTVLLDGVPWEIVGVMPAGFRSPLGSRADLWVPQDLRAGGSNGFGNYYMSAVARLRDGLTVEAAQERIRTLSVAYGERQPDVEGSFPRLVPLRDDVVGATRRSMLWILTTAAVLVLLTACVNVANLLFARGLSRDRDLALRSALGSGRARLVVGILTENGLLAAGGGLAGVGLAWMGVRALEATAPQALPSMIDLHMGGTVFAFGLLVTLVTLLVFGLTPAWRLSRTAPADVLRSGDRAATAGLLVRRIRGGLVVLQVAAAVVLVAGGLLLARSFGSLLDVPLGIEAGGVLTYEVHLPTARYPDGAARQAFYEELHDRVARLPGVRSVGATSWLPANGRYHTWGFYWDPEATDGSNDDAWYPTDVRVIAGDYFGSMGIELLAGRDPRDTDLESEAVAWVNQGFEQVFGDLDPVGQQIWLAGAVRRIAGVVESIPYSVRGDLSRKAYVPHVQYADNRNWALVQTVRAEGSAADLHERIRQELHAMDGALVMYRPRAFDDVLSGARAQDRFATLLMGAFAGLALLLSLVGTYGVLAGTVAGRFREIGVRMALGADAGRVRRMVLRYAASLTIPGLALGLVGAWVAGRWVEALLFGVSATDPITYVAVVAIFVVAGLLSGWLPAERATRVDTIRTLSAD
jgi:predicted permease